MLLTMRRLACWTLQEKQTNNWGEQKELRLFFFGGVGGGGGDIILSRLLEKIALVVIFDDKLL